jgi:hypothetical protein
MKFIMKKLLVISAILLSGCTTIHFDKNANLDLNASKHETWHHNIVLSLVEVSDPVNLKQECGDQEWSSVKTELSFLNGLAGGVAGIVVPFIWYPKTVEVSCN